MQSDISILQCEINGNIEVAKYLAKTISMEFDWFYDGMCSTFALDCSDLNSSNILMIFLISRLFCNLCKETEHT